MKGNYPQIQESIAARKPIQGLDFRHMTFDGENFAKGMFIHCLFDGCTFKGCDLTKVHFVECQMTECQFIDNTFLSSKMTGSNLSHSQWQGDVIKLMVTDCSLSQSYWSSVNIQSCNFSLGDMNNALFEHSQWKTVACSKVEMKATKFDYMHFENVSWTDTDFTKLILNQCKFIRALLLKCDLSGLNFAGLSFHHCSCNNSRFVGTNFKQAQANNNNFSHSELKNCDFREAALTKSLFVESVLEDCDFSGSDVSHGKFSKAKLNACSFVNSDLTQSSFQHATLDTVDFTESHLAYANLSYVSAIKCLFEKCTVQRTNIHALVDEKCCWHGTDRKGLLVTDKTQQKIDTRLEPFMSR